MKFYFYLALNLYHYEQYCSVNRRRVAPKDLGIAIGSPENASKILSKALTN